jgi:type I site-specific restriction endonuclease
MTYYINVTENNRCKMVNTLEGGLYDDYCNATAFKTRKDAQEYIDEWLDDGWKENATIEIHDNWYISWADDANTGFVDYAEDFVSDDIEERAMWFETEEDAQEYIEKMKEENPFCCYLNAVEYLDEE